jgi:hypothetical protein
MPATSFFDWLLDVGPGMKDHKVGDWHSGKKPGPLNGFALNRMGIRFPWWRVCFARDGR